MSVNDDDDDDAPAAGGGEKGKWHGTGRLTRGCKVLASW